MHYQLSQDIVIIGGGISGLFTLHRLKNLGFNVLLLEKNELGGGQTICAQGIIHGGIKYSLKGLLTPSANAIQKMPNRWQNCLQGQGEIDLRDVKILSSSQHLWSRGSLSSDLTTFFASKALSGRVQKLSKSEYPFILQHPQFKGQVYKLSEMVLDLPSLIRVLATPNLDHILNISSLQLQHLVQDNTHSLKSLLFKDHDNTYEINAKLFIFAAGEGNDTFLNSSAGKSIWPNLAMQKRPLHMVFAKMPNKDTPLYAHCMDNDTNPRITITSHTDNASNLIWYLGGQLAETGVQRNSAAQIAFARKELNTLFPWLDFGNIELGSFWINRAEPKTEHNKRPDSFFVKSANNTIMVWPTKLALAPLMTDSILDLVTQFFADYNLQPAKQINNLQNNDILIKLQKKWGDPNFASLRWDGSHNT